MNSQVRQLPSIDALLERYAAEGISREVLTEILREAVAALRAEILKGTATDAGVLDERIQKALAAAKAPFYRRAINATGIILHTGLGRAVLPEAAVEQIAAELRGYSILQIDMETGERGRRDEGVERLLKLLTGAESATVVNNCAAATMLALSAVAKGKEVIVSRGQLIEIGGEFRLPDVMAASGVRMVEIGTTNKTHLRDYQRAINENTGAIIRVHPSNYRIHGFTKAVSTAELVELARPLGIPVIDDLGAGALVDFSRFGFEKEPTIRESIASGADLVLSSADKLIGGPQGGLILGGAKWVERCRKDPLARMMRVDKVTLAALEATLRLFLDEPRAMQAVPTLAMLCKPLDELEATATRICAGLGKLHCEASVEPDVGYMGGGSLPEDALPSRVVVIRPRNMDAEALSAALRKSTPSIIARIRHDAVILDPRTLQAGEEEQIVAALNTVLRIL